MKKITTSKGTYLIRGNHTVGTLKLQYASFVNKYNSTISFDEYLRTQGKVYVKTK